MRTNPQKTVDLVTFAEEILNRKLHVYALVFAQVYVLFTACLRLAIVGSFGNRFNLTHFPWSIFLMHVSIEYVFYALTSV